ncbi:UDP-4-amino-4,6-dideoxy-N-acetyl-beta-L-altrosamine transaminase [Thiohalorhabdus methylotrophus]|uniref:UDP-4-amino-4, 6-dideoxy-N-acetyl-beta-L-altrosamine transaminase n=1 Tax=Thiohalorhabdus methylotrophus TaxID=3242694 RepID=A0ABV4U170_9GAMM
MIPYGRQEVTEDDIEAVVEVLRSNLITQGPVAPRFEEAVRDYCRASHAVAVSSGTAGLHLACHAMGLGPGDWLWTSPITFVASANCGLYCGADVDFVDIDPATRNMSVEALKHKLEQAETEGQLPKVVVPVHFAGLSCDMAAIRELADRYGFWVLEDAAHAFGGEYRGEPVGACRFSDAAVFSFHPVKNITTGEGGMVTTRRLELATRIERLRSHGITREPAHMIREPDGPWYYEQGELGLNYRLTDIQAALGLSQLQRLDTFIQARRNGAVRYSRLLADLPLILPGESSNSHSAWHLYVVELGGTDPQAIRREVFEALREQGWGVNVHYIPVHWQPDYARECRKLPAAEAYYSRALTIPLFPGLTEGQQEAFAVDLSQAIHQARPVGTA